MIKSYRTLSVFTILLVFAFTGLYAQQTTGIISGVVSDETGGVLPGVEVTARNTGTEATRTVISDDEGRYRLLQLAPGDYELRAELTGFQTAILQDISLSIAQGAVVSVTLRVGAISEQVVVSAEVSLVDTQSATVASLVDSQQIRDLPLNGRDFLQLATLQDGVVMPTGMRKSVNGDLGTKISIGGARAFDNAILLDGTDIKNQYGTSPGSVAGGLLGVDTVREFRVITSAYSAEYGRFTGGVISAVTRSGSNQLHGTLFEFHRNSALDARNFFDRDPLNPTVRSKPPNFIRNQFGFTLGGPIVKDRTFFFGSYEGFRERLTLTEISNFPSEDAKNGLLPLRVVDSCSDIRGELCFVGVDPLVQPYMDMMISPNAGDTGNGFGRVSFSNPHPINEDYFVIKVDHQLSDSDNFFVRYTFDDSEGSQLNEGILYTQEDTNRYQYLTLEEKHIFSPTLLNEFRVAFNRSSNSTDEVGTVDESLWLSDVARQKATGFEGGMGLIFCRGCGMSQFGTSTRTPGKSTLNTWQFMDNLVWTRGRHSLKMGVSFSRFQFNARNFARLQGTWQFDSLQDLMERSFTEASVFFGDLQSNPIPIGLRQSLVGIYFQDDLQFTPNLTFNLGVRYEFITSPSEVAGRIANYFDISETETTPGNPYFENPSLKNFSPRFGFAWDPTGSGKSSVRGGVGLFHQQILTWCCTSTSFRAPPFAIRGVLGRNSAGIRDFPNGLRNLDENFEGAGTPELFVNGQPNQSYMLGWSLTLQQELTGSIAATAAYKGSQGTKLSRVGDINRSVAVQLPGGGWKIDNPNSRSRQNSNFQRVAMRRWDGQSYYHALSLGLRKRFSGGNMFQLSYQWQKSIDDGSSVAGSPRETFNDGWLSQNILDKNTDRGLSAFSVAHSFNTNFALELPFGPGRRYGANADGFLGQLIGGWQINGIIQLATGSPQFLEGDPTGTCLGGCNNINANIKEGYTIPLARDPNGWYIDPELLRDPTLTVDDPRFPFENPVPGFYGNVSRGSIEGPGFATVDLSVLKNFPVGEQVQIQFRAEAFNIFNRTNFQGPTRANDTIGRNKRPVTTFGELTETVNFSRQIQLALKITF